MNRKLNTNFTNRNILNKLSSSHEKKKNKNESDKCLSQILIEN
jgi:hypothetical protein